MSQILTLDRMKTMSIDEIIGAYQSGYTIPENVETNLDIYSSNIYSSNIDTNNIIYPATTDIKSLQHYTTTDIGVIAAAIGISVGILGLLAYYYMKREEKRILKEVKESVLGSVGRYGPSALEKIVEKLAPTAERIAERILPEKKYT